MTMRKNLMSLLIPLAAVAGCGRLDDEYKAAVPSKDEVTIQLPDKGGSGTASAGSHGRIDQALLGETSEFYLWTRGITTVVNGSALVLIGILDAITDHPATSQTQNSRTWGPYAPGGLDPLSYRLVVTKLGPKQFSFSLEARAKGSQSEADFLPLLDGEATREAGVHKGKGTMSLHFDNARKLHPATCERGTIVYAFDNTAGVATLDVVFSQFANQNTTNKLCRDEAPADAQYRYERAADGAGNFVFTVGQDIHKLSEQKPLREKVSMRSRWQASGAGRSDVRISEGEVTQDLAKAGFQTNQVVAAECWNGSFQVVYETSTPAQIGIRPTDGDEKQCAFTAAQLP
jgi:hypothetical protein